MTETATRSTDIYDEIGAHLVAGSDEQARAPSFVVISFGLVGPPIVRMVCGAKTSVQILSGPGLGLLIVLVASILTWMATFIANGRTAFAS